MKNSLLASDSQAMSLRGDHGPSGSMSGQMCGAPPSEQYLLPQSLAKFEQSIAVRRTGMILIDGAGSVIPFAHMVIAEGGELS